MYSVIHHSIQYLIKINSIRILLNNLGSQIEALLNSPLTPLESGTRSLNIRALEFHPSYWQLAPKKNYPNSK